MTNGFDEAKAQRNWLERLGEKIPGFRGFQDRELRREVDKMQREYLAGSIADLKGVVRDRARSYTDAAQIGSLHLFDRLDRFGRLCRGVIHRVAQSTTSGQRAQSVATRQVRQVGAVDRPTVGSRRSECGRHP